MFQDSKYWYDQLKKKEKNYKQNIWNKLLPQQSKANLNNNKMNTFSPFKYAEAGFLTSFLFLM